MDHNNALILIVEDESIVAQELRERLQELGYDVCSSVASGEDAVLAADRYRPDLVLMDIVLQGELNGLDAAEIIASRYDIPVIYLTAIRDDVTLNRARGTKPYGYIVKPFDGMELHFAIEVALDKHDVEQEVKKREQMLSAILNSVKEGVITTDTGFLINFINPVAERITGWTSEEVMGKPIHTYLHVFLNNASRTPANLFESLQKDSSCTNQELSLRDRHGNDFSIEINSTPLKDVDNELSGWVIVFRDISKRKTAEAIFQASEEKYRVMVESLKDGIGMIDEKGVITFVNKATCSMLGYRKQDLVGQHVSMLLDDENTDIFRKQIISRPNGGQSPYSISLTHKDKRHVTVLIKPHPLFDEAGSFKGSFTILNELSKAQEIPENLP